MGQMMRNQSRDSLSREAKPANRKAAFVFLSGYLKEQALLFFFMLFFALAASFCSLYAPKLIGEIIDQDLTPAFVTKQVPASFYKNIVFLVSLYLAAAACAALQGVLSAKFSTRLIQSLRSDIFAKLLRVNLKYLDGQKHGDLMSRLTNDADNINNGFSSSLAALFSNGALIIGALAFMLISSPLLTLSVIFVAPASLLIAKTFIKMSRKIFYKQQEYLGRLNGYLEEHILGQKEIKSFCRESIVKEEFAKINGKLKKASINAQAVSGLLPPLMNAINNLGFACLILLGAYLAIKQQGGVTIGLIAAFTQYARQFARPINEAANQANVLQSVLAGAERIAQLMNAPEEPKDKVNALSWRADGSMPGSVRFNHVAFSYQPQKPVLKDLSFEVKAGQMAAIVGPTGAGKTTIINLLLRFYKIDKGLITINNTPIDQIKLFDLRSSLGIVLQDNYLFSGTIRDNVLYGKPSASEEEMRLAAHTALADQFIDRLELGYDTPVTAGGANFSQGQRQLIAIARTLLANPSILILDEATSAIDTRTEALVQKAMDRLSKGRTSLVIAHRLSTVRRAATIAYVSDGGVLEAGSHDELMLQKGRYYELYMSQFAGGSDSGLSV